MAKGNRFPSDANKTKKQAIAVGSPGIEASVESAPSSGKSVKGVKQELVQVGYHKANHHVLGIGVHALAPGLNHLPKSIWEEAAKHPSIQQMIKDKHITPPKSKDDPVAIEADDEDAEDSDLSEAESE